MGGANPVRVEFNSFPFFHLPTLVCSCKATVALSQLQNMKFAIITGF
jgi:hypothetical protein